ncbi:hypothetical protein ACQP0C_10130 [Nocardia sp. CA-129566]|uniref:hypothetical protein n=1 Tax=Nocardia sp. CA-129566 TaxID=3239976 RepID=UPI003D978395
MTRFLEALAGKLAEKWLTLLVLPGTLYLAVAITALELGQRHWYDLPMLRDMLTRLASQPAARTAGTVVLGLAGLLAAASVAGLAAKALGAMIIRWWLAPARDPISRWLLARRAVRWERARTRFEQARLFAGRAQRDNRPDASELVRIAEGHNAARNRIALEPPRHPFWLGDRIVAVDRRVLRRYQLDLASTWPRLWLIVPEAARAELGTAHAALTSAGQMAGWALSYLALGTLWWPAAVAGAFTALAAWHRTKESGDALAALIESAVDLHGRTLAESLGITCPGPLTAEMGTEITALLRKDT